MNRRGMALGLVLAALVARTTAAQPTPAPASPPRIADLAWLEGTWASSSAGVVVEERWTPPAGGAMLGTSRTLRGDRMAFFEFLRIVTRDGALFYIAQPGGRPPTEFRLTRAEGMAAVFENPQHDHPKVIRYTRKSDTLTAEVEGDEAGKPVKETFVLTRVR